MQHALVIEPTGRSDFENCECCGRNSRKVWGLVRTAEGSVASYFVHWTLGHVEEVGANFDLIIGRWGEGTSASDRRAASLEYRLLESGPTFRVIDAQPRSFAKNELVGSALSRNDVIGQPISGEVFSICDAILAQDDRVAELLGSWSVGERGTK